MRSKDPDKLDRIVEYVDSYNMDYCRAPSIRDIAKYIGLSAPTTLDYIRELVEQGRLEQDGGVARGLRTKKMVRSIEERMVSVPQVGSIPCGLPMLEEENITDYFTLPEKLIGKGKFFFLKACGDSMVGVGIDDGDLVLIRQQEEANNGDIVVALTDYGENTLRTFYRKRSKIILHPENDKYEDIIVKECRIQGVAVKVLKNL